LTGNVAQNGAVMHQCVTSYSSMQFIKSSRLDINSEFEPQLNEYQLHFSVTFKAKNL